MHLDGQEELAVATKVFGEKSQWGNGELGVSVIALRKIL